MSLRKPAPRAEHYLSKLQKTMATYWDGLALCDYHGIQYTFGALARKIERIHIALEAAGVKKGDKITLCGKNSANWAVSFLSITTYEAVVVPLLSDFLPEAVERLTDHSDSTVLFTDAELFEKRAFHVVSFGYAFYGVASRAVPVITPPDGRNRHEKRAV